MTCSQTVADSLMQLLAVAKRDSTRVNLLNDIAWELKISHPDSAIALLDQSLALARRAGFRKGEAQGYNFKGVIADIQSRYSDARRFFEQALAIRLSLGDTPGVASIYANIGNVLRSEGDLVGAMQQYREALTLAEALGDSARMARTNYSMAVLYETLGSYNEAMDCIYRNLEISEALGDLSSAARSYNVIGNIKSELENFDEALLNYRKALDLYVRDGDDWGQADALQNIGNALDNFGEYTEKKGQLAIATDRYHEALEHYRKSMQLRLQLEDREGESACYNNMGVCYKHLKQFDTALDLFQRALEIRRDLNDKRGIAEVYNGIGDIRRRQRRYRDALQLTEQYYAIALEMQDQKFIQMALLDFSRCYEALGDFRNAYRYRKEFDEYRYARINEKRLNDLERREALYGDNQKKLRIERQNQELKIQKAELAQARIRQYSLFGGAIALSLLAFLLYNRNRLKTRVNRELAKKNEVIAQEQERSEALLLNILPEETARELRDTGAAHPRYYEAVSVLFTDFKSFTLIAEQYTPEALVAELDTCFRAFDAIVEKHGLEKIKTIGDAYMCAAGLPELVPDHALRAVAAALEMQAYMTARGEALAQRGQPAFEMRAGIHSGPVVAGVVGSRKFAYDIWGDAVNLAARIESAGAVGRVNISGTTHSLVSRNYSCTYRGKVEAKGKGEVDMYFVDTDLRIDQAMDR